jgi:hypothetical protein
MASFNATAVGYGALLADVDAGRFIIPNENIDVGRPTPAGKYLGTDLTYDKLLGELAGYHFAGISEDLRGNILEYYKDRLPPPSSAPKKARADWAKLLDSEAATIP